MRSQSFHLNRSTPQLLNLFPLVTGHSLSYVSAMLKTITFLVALVVAEPAFAQSTAAPLSKPDVVRDGQHDFDFEIGKWDTHLWRLEHPLSHSYSWIEYWGTSDVRKVWGGRANLIELDVTGPAGHIEALSLRLYNPKTHEWSLNFASSAVGTMTPPTTGAFKDGRGEFYDNETFHGRPILVRFVISDIKPDSCRFEQAFSEDNGKTWEVNWIAIDTRTNH